MSAAFIWVRWNTLPCSMITNVALLKSCMSNTCEIDGQKLEFSLKTKEFQSTEVETTTDDRVIEHGGEFKKTLNTYDAPCSK